MGKTKGRRCLGIIIIFLLNTLLSISSGVVGAARSQTRREGKEKKDGNYHPFSLKLEKSKPKEEGSLFSSVEEEVGCSSWFCKAGEECVPGEDSSLPTCRCIEDCGVSRKKEIGWEWSWIYSSSHHDEEEKGYETMAVQEGPVCGSDGNVYPSLCELYRTACLTANPRLGVVSVVSTASSGNSESTATSTSCDGDKYSPPAPALVPAAAADRKSDSDSDSGESEDASEEEEEEDYEEEEKEYSESGEIKRRIKFIPHNNARMEPTTMSTVERKPKRGSTLCSLSEYEIFKEALLTLFLERLKLKGARKDYYFERLSNGTFVSEKSKMIKRLFKSFDKNRNGDLSYLELQRIGFDPVVGPLLLHCHPVDFLRFDDDNENGLIDLQEWNEAFHKINGNIKNVEREIKLTGKVGESLEIKCDISPSSSSSSSKRIQWQRYQSELDAGRKNYYDVTESANGDSLTFTRLQHFHTGQFSCSLDSQEQQYYLQVISEPEVIVNPHLVWEQQGSDVSLECRLSGEPPPNMSWLKNEVEITATEKYQMEGPLLRVKDVHAKDTGAYMCQGENKAGKRFDITSVLVVDEDSPSLSPVSFRPGRRNESLFVILHKRGISAFDPEDCRLHHHIDGLSIIPGTQRDLMCEPLGCEWGTGISVATSYIYVSQPQKRRVLIVSLAEMVVVDVINTISQPLKLHYLQHTDQVWIECGMGSNKTIQVVRNAKEKRKHKVVHLNQKFLANTGELRSVFLPKDAPHEYGYITKNGARGLYKVELKSLRYVKSVDLSKYNCLPETLHFSSFYGFVLLECHEPVLGRSTGQIVLDYLTDSVVHYYPQSEGHTYISPDSRFLVTIKNKRKGTEFLVQEITVDGLRSHFEVRNTVNVSDITFFPSQSHQSFDLFATAINQKHLLFLDLRTGVVDTVEGVGKPPPPGETIVPQPQRPISAEERVFSKYLVSPGRDGAVFVINGKSHTVNCQLASGSVRNVSSIMWIDARE